MSNEQPQQQPTQVPVPEADPRREFAKKAALSAIGAVVSALTREAIKQLGIFGDES